MKCPVCDKRIYVSAGRDVFYLLAEHLIHEHMQHMTEFPRTCVCGDGCACCGNHFAEHIQEIGPENLKEHWLMARIANL